MKLTEKEQKDLVFNRENKDFKIIDEKLLFMDSHGENVNLVVLENLEDHKMYGFTYNQNSEETTFSKNIEPFELDFREVVVNEYFREDGGEIK